MDDFMKPSICIKKGHFPKQSLILRGSPFQVPTLNNWGDISCFLIVYDKILKMRTFLLWIVLKTRANYFFCFQIRKTHIFLVPACQARFRVYARCIEPWAFVGWPGLIWCPNPASNVLGRGTRQMQMLTTRSNFVIKAFDLTCLIFNEKITSWCFIFWSDQLEYANIQMRF